MDAYEAITTKLDVREFASRHIPGEIKRKILEAARLTGSSMNTQHWRFLVIQDRPSLKTLAKDSTSGAWIEGADFAIVILTDPKVSGYMIDTGRVLQAMELAAWSLGVVSGVYTGIREDGLRKDYGFPAEVKPTAVLGFGYPKQKILGKKKRKPIEDLAFSEHYGKPLNLGEN